MYPGGTWIGGIDPFGDIMGTSAGPEREEKIYLFKQTAQAKVTSHLHSSAEMSYMSTVRTNMATHIEGNGCL